MPRGCNLARREIVRVINYIPHTNGKEGCCYIPSSFVLYFFGQCISWPLLVVLHVGFFILLWCEMLFVFVSPFCNEVMWSLR